MKGLLPTMCAALALAGCNSKRESPEVERAWVRLAAVPGRPAVAYFIFKAGGIRQVFTRVTLDVAGKAEMHETMAKGAMSMMAPLTRVEVPAGGSVVFAPGGRHVMLFDLDPAIKPGGQLTFDVGDANGVAASGRARVVAAGDPAPY